MINYIAAVFIYIYIYIYIYIHIDMYIYRERFIGAQRGARAAPGGAREGGEGRLEMQENNISHCLIN